MAEITASLVKELRERTGAGMMECKKALTENNGDIDASAEALKARYKELVKRHHPDANGGDRSHEDRLRSVIQAYNYLKAQGFC